MPRLGDVGNPDGTPNEDLDRLRGFLSDRSEAAGFVKHNVRLDRYDVRLFRELLESSEELRALAKAEGAPETFGPLLVDLFVFFYKVQPALLDEGSVDPACFRANRPFVWRLREDEETMILRLTTAMDEVASGLATIEAGKEILDELRRRPDLHDWMDRQARAGEASRDEPPTATPAADYSEHPSGFAADPPPAAGLRASARAASKAASAEADAHAAALSGWGLEPRDLRVVPLGERLDLARKLRTRRMRDLANLLGRMRNARRAAERRRVRANRDEVHSVETGGELHRALPSEIAGAFGLKNPLRRRDFYRRLSERSVLSYSLRTEEPAGRGPVIAMIDASGSMSGERMEWASAVALALAHAASGGSVCGARRVHAIFFNARIVLEVELAPGERDARKFLAIGTVEADGGTDYVPPMRRALEILSGGAADLLLVTDGLCELPDGFADRLAAEKEEKGFKLVSVLIGDSARKTPGGIAAFSDRVVRAEDLGGAQKDAAAEVFEAL